MKMKLWKRISIMLFSVMTLALLGLFALEVFDCGYGERVANLITDAEGNYVTQWLALALAGFALVAILCVLMFLMAARDGRIKAARMIKLRDEGGDHVLLEQETLDALVLRSLGNPEGVSDIKIVTAYTDEQLVILIDVAVASNINIPETTRDMQQNVRTQIAQISGIKVSDVSIRISTIKIPDGYDSQVRRVKSAGAADDAEQAPLSAPEEAQSGAPIQPEPVSDDMAQAEYAYAQRAEREETEAPADIAEKPEIEREHTPGGEIEADAAQAPAFDFGEEYMSASADEQNDAPSAEFEPDALFGAQQDNAEEDEVSGEENEAFEDGKSNDA